MYKTDEDKFYISKTEMEERLISLLGGRASEALILDDISTGASNDIEVISDEELDELIENGGEDCYGEEFEVSASW